MDEAVDIIFRDSFGYAFGAPDVDIVEVEVSGRFSLWVGRRGE